MPALQWLPPGTRFRLVGMPEVTGVLVKANECRAVVRLDKPERDVEFEDAEGNTRHFKTRGGQTTSWAPTTSVEAIGFETIITKENEMSTTTKKTKAPKQNAKPAKKPASNASASTPKKKGKEAKLGLPLGENAAAAAKKTKPKTDGKMSCLDAAAHILAETGNAMTTGELIEAMAAKGLWTSPGGKTPAATLYSAILRELKKPEGCRFKKTDKGKFAHT